MVNKELFDRYILALRKTPVEDKTEHTDRAPLQSLLQDIADKLRKASRSSTNPSV